MCRLNNEQDVILDHVVKNGHSCFITGKAGSGKSCLACALIDIFEARLSGKDELLVASMVGLTACQFRNGRTFHSTFGFPCSAGKLTFDELFDKYVNTHPWAKARIRNCKVLIIDEISYMDYKTLDNFYKCLKKIREPKRTYSSMENPDEYCPFNDMKVIFIGDFMQVIPDLDNRAALPFIGYRDVNTKEFIDELNKSSNVPKQSIEKVHEGRPPWSKLGYYVLEGGERQRGDLLRFLDLVRYGIDNITSKDHDFFWPFLRELTKPKVWPGGMKPVRIFGTNTEINEENKVQLEQLRIENESSGVRADVISYKAIDEGDFEDTASEDQQKIKLQTNLLPVYECITGQPVIYLKNSNGLVNGSCGVVEEFLPGTTAPTGDLEKIGEFPQNIAEFPVIRFRLGGDMGYKRVLVGFGKSKCEATSGLECSRFQIPLRPSWALTVHRAQGMTLDLVELNISSFFCANMFYSGSSRATTAEYLQINGLSESDIQILRKVCCKYKLTETEKEISKCLKRRFMHHYDAREQYLKYWNKPHPNFPREMSK